MKDMAYSKDEQKNEARPMMPDKPKYPYGLCLHLDDKILKKLGLDGLPEIGKKVKIEAYAEVKSVSASDSAEGGMYKSCDLQITEMEVEVGEGDSKAAKELYGE